MNKQSTILLGAVLVFAISFGGLQFRGKRALARSLVESKAESASLRDELAIKSESAKALESSLDQMTFVLTNATAQLDGSKALCADYKARLDALEVSASEMAQRKKLTEECPAVRSGAQIAFPKLLAKSGSLLMPNAEFRSEFGKRLIFKSGNDIEAFDIDQLHPGVLLQLNIDPQAAKDNQSKLEQSGTAFDNARRMAAQNIVRMQSQIIAQQVALEAQKEKQMEADRKEQFEKNMRLQAAENDRIRANAAMLHANAAMTSALRPW